VYRRLRRHAAASLVGIFLIPVLYVVFQRVREKLKAGSWGAARANGIEGRLMPRRCHRDRLKLALT
jgi:hypothetical protein